MIYITWLNNLGGFEYWPMVGKADYNHEVIDSGETKTNIFPRWGKSYDDKADTIRKQTFRKTRKSIVLRTHSIDKTTATELSEGIKNSVLVQILDTKKNRRTVIVDTDSITIYRERDKMHAFAFTASFTDDLPGQTV